MYRVLSIAVLAAITLTILSVEFHNQMVLEKVSSPDTRILNMINSTDHGNGTGTHAFAQDAKPASALNKSWSDENIIKFPTKCRGSALCPDYDYYLSSF